MVLGVPRTTRAAAWLAIPILFAPAACTRPVTGRDFQGSTVRDLVVSPDHLRANVPFGVRFRLDGGLGGAAKVTLAGHALACAAERLADGAYGCQLAGITRQDYAEGPAELALEVADRVGRTSRASATITIDFACPSIASLTVTPPIGTPGGSAVVEVQANELLGEPPIVSRAGRLWEAATGSGTTYSVTHPITETDVAEATDIVVRLVDLAGNTSGDCGIDGHVPFGVDRAPPSVDPTKVELQRDIPGQPATLSAAAGAFTDDVAVREVHVEEESADGSRVIATLAPLPDGSIPPTSLGAEPRGRVHVVAVDAAGKTSARVLVEERWRLSAGRGATPNAAVRTAVRYTPAPPRSTAMENRTRELALKIFAEDTESAEVAAHVGFRAIGQLPTSYRDTSQMAAGYEPKSRTVVAFGGRVRDVEGERGDTLLLRWNELTHEYESEVMAEAPGLTPLSRAGLRIAFDGRGCGVLFGGEKTERWLNDTWQLCATSGGLVWRDLDAADAPEPRLAPILWDPSLERYAIAAGLRSTEATDVWILDPGSGDHAWRWVPLALPDDLSSQDRFFELFYYEPKYRGYGLATGATSPVWRGTDFWSFSDGGWAASTVPAELAGRAGFGWDYDRARSMLVLWGDAADQLAREGETPVLDPSTWLLAGDPRSGSQSWRRVNLGPSLLRGFPSVVYDSDREATLVFGGVRTIDATGVPAVLEEMVTSPSFPYLQATLDLGVPRPTGIAALELSVRATGAGDGDGLGPSATRAGGVTVLLWDHGERRWVEAASMDTPPAGDPVPIAIEIQDRPSRFVSLDGVVPVTVVSRWPATEDADARLAVDAIDGALVLSSAAPHGAAIEGFTVDPEVAARGDAVTIAWTVSNAPGGVELAVGGSVVFTSTRSSGTFSAEAGVTTSLRLRAINAAEGDATAERRLTVRSAEAPPLVVDFTAGAKAGRRGGAIPLSWQVDRASVVRILRGETEVFATSTLAARGVYVALLPLDPTATSTTFTLEAKSEAGRELRKVDVRLAHAVGLRGPGATYTWSGAIFPAGDVDLYQLELTAPGYVDASVWVPARPDCDPATDLYLAIYDARLEYLDSSDDGDVGRCPHIRAFDDPHAFLPAGTYFLAVEDYSGHDTVASYTLEVATSGIACGNGLKEPGEACDDGNRVSGDGCSAECRFEPIAAYDLPAAGSTVISGAIAVGHADVYRLDVSAPTFVDLETFAPTRAAGCPSADTLLELFAEDMTTRLGTDDDSGLHLCSLMPVLLDPGTYFVVVHEGGDDDDVPAYELALDVGPSLPVEVEPNGDPASATPLSLVAAGDPPAPIAAAFEPAGDVDYFSFTLTATQAVTISVFGDPRDRARCGGIDSVMTLYDSAAHELAFSDDANDACSIIDGIGGAHAAASALPPGTYFVALASYHEDTTTPGYLVDLEVR